MINNVSHFSGTVKTIDQTYSHLGLTEVQSYFLFTGVFLTLIILIICIKQLVDGVLSKSCIGCKRLKKCEDDIKKIKQTIALQGYFTPESFKEVSQKLDDIKKELRHNG